MPLGRDEYPKVARSASLFRLHQHACRVGAYIWRSHCVLPHRLDEGAHELGEVNMPATHRRARQLETLARVDLLEAMQREVILPTPHDRVGEEARPGETALDGQR